MANSVWQIAKKGTWIALLAIGYLLLAAPAAQAQVGFALNKSVFDIEVLPGVSHDDSIVVANTSASAPLPIEVLLTLWNLKEDSDDIEYVQAEPLLNATRWFTRQDGTILSGLDLLLGPGDDTEIEFRIRPPVGTPPGTYLVAMQFLSAPQNFTEGGTRLIPAVSVLFFIKVPNLNLDAAVSEYAAQLGSFGPVGGVADIYEGVAVRRANAGVFSEAVKSLVAQIKNTGIYYFKASGKVEIKNMFGRVVATVDIPLRYLLPNRTRNVPITIFPEKDAETGFFGSLLYAFKENSYVGPYTATIVLAYPDSGRAEAKVFAQEDVRFWVVPWKFWTTTVVLLVSLLYVLRHYRSRLWLACKALFKR